MTTMQIALNTILGVGLVFTILSGIVSKVPKEDIAWACIGFGLIFFVMWMQ